VSPVLDNLCQGGEGSADDRDLYREALQQNVGNTKMAIGPRGKHDHAGFLIELDETLLRKISRDLDAVCQSCAADLTL
jgi:hypothetical protein